MKLIGSILLSGLDRRGKTQKAAAKDLGMSNATINKAVHGKSIAQKTGVRLCEYLNIELAAAVAPRLPATEVIDATRANDRREIEAVSQSRM